MEVIINHLLELIAENNVLTYDSVIKIISRDSIIDDYKGHATCFERELYVKMFPDQSQGVFYIKWGYNIKLPNKGKVIELIHK